MGRWIGVGIGVLVVGVAMATLLPTLLAGLFPPELRAPDEWRFSHVVDPPDGWTVEQRILTRDTELTVLGPTPSGQLRPRCVVRLTRAGAPAGADRGRRVLVNGRPGRYVESRSEDPRITWGYAPGAVATVACFEEVPRATLLTVAEAVHFQDSRVHLPFTFDALPASYRVASIDQREELGVRSVGVTLEPLGHRDVPSVTVRHGGDQPADRCLPATPAEHGSICLDTSWSAEEAPYAAGRERNALSAVEDRLRLAPDLGDRSTWFDAVDLPG